MYVVPAKVIVVVPLISVLPLTPTVSLSPISFILIAAPSKLMLDTPVVPPITPVTVISPPPACKLRVLAPFIVLSKVILESVVVSTVFAPNVTALL